MPKAQDLQEFTVDSYHGFTWQKWTGTGFDRSKEYKEGYQQQHSVKLVSGDWLNLTSEEMGRLLLAALRDNKSDIAGKKFTVKTVEGKKWVGADGKERARKNSYFTLAEEKEELAL